MSAIPLLGRKLPPFHQGAEFEYGPISVTVAATLPDPNDWTVLKLLIHPGGMVDDVESDSADAAVAPVYTGTGPWTGTLYFPLTEEQTSTLPAKTCDFRIIFETSAGGQDVLVEGTVEVRAMHQAEWDPLV